MRKYTQLFALAIIAAFATAFAGTASANIVTASPSGAITATSSGKVTFSGGELAIECRVTLRGSINSTIDNSAGGNVGSITGGSANECGFLLSATLLFGVAWGMEMSEEARLGVSPKLVGINMVGTRFLVSIFGVQCLYEGTVPTWLEGEGSPVVTRRVRILANSTSYVSGAGSPEPCAEYYELAGSFDITTQTLRL